MDSKQVWFVTGASKGLGLTLIEELLKAGHRVAATSRDAAGLAAAIGGLRDGAVGLAVGAEGISKRFLAVAVSLTNEESVQAGVEAALAHFGRIDVVVNNAGYGQFGTLEELSDKEARDNFDINVFGALNVIRRVMPHFRTRRRGLVFNIASIGGFAGGYPGWGIYCATKFAVAGFTEALAAEVKEFGVRAVAVYPGYFRTSFLAAGSLTMPTKSIADYAAARESQVLHQQQLDGQQPGDPVKAARVLMQVAMAEEQPVHLFLGQDAYEVAGQKIEIVQKDLETWKGLASATNF